MDLHYRIPYSGNILYKNTSFKAFLPIEDLLDIAGMYKAPKGKNALQAREYMESHYKRG